MRQVGDSIGLYELAKIAGGPYRNLVRGVVDVRKEVMAVDVELHAHAAQFLAELGSHPDDLWGFNLYPDKFGTSDFIELNAPINVRPAQQNRSFGIENQALRDKITAIIQRKVQA